ncbi:MULTISPECIES: Arc family DNA-binding protein [Klebsiella]|jgi:predicted HicB family RNase H-like nuclease|uniref:Repressor n=1 Tax=Siphoviridae sp. ctUyy2 TaxID=2827574 RepID=A0A8S5LMC7_9CAUD|nr:MULTISPECIES: Arc family DNA-binding protein [Klebsiella]DAD71244.1 MAG TPA: repressor [Siphoviridae sp. ctUyy2]DAE71330.1 MAG TPA: repressor [Caudoviricetes sp.]HBX9978364.1 Arc family DNA-binding protein [Klebsiella variicola]EIW8572173.1 Arc family DNA-binding protein [Klebsiella pneumoniae]MCJ7325473.1 Arc family DNA-binding protein [Klebsiella quasipneumoniae]
MKKAVSTPPTGIRFDSNIKELLKIAAKREGRSVNSEVIKRIERSLKEDGYIKA